MEEGKTVYNINIGRRAEGGGWGTQLRNTLRMGCDASREDTFY